MKIKLELSELKYISVKEQLLKLGVEIDDNADLILIEKGLHIDQLTVIEPESKEFVRLDVADIVYIESYGHTVEVCARNKIFSTSYRLYQIIAMLNPEKFIRISNSVIISKKSVKRIKPTFSSKFILTLSNDKEVDVTRSYYALFKESFNL